MVCCGFRCPVVSWTARNEPAHVLGWSLIGLSGMAGRHQEVRPNAQEVSPTAPGNLPAARNPSEPAGMPKDSLGKKTWMAWIARRTASPPDFAWRPGLGACSMEVRRADHGHILRGFLVQVFGCVSEFAHVRMDPGFWIHKSPPTWAGETAREAHVRRLHRDATRVHATTLATRHAPWARQ